MKKNVFALVAGYFATLVAINGANAQNSVNTERLENQKNIPEIEKVITSVTNQKDDLAGISPRALKNFAETYKNAPDASWEKIKNGFSAKFILNGVISLVYYNSHGSWAGILKGYIEDKMPPEIRKIVKREYYDYAITYVQEAETIGSNGIPTYFVIVEDDNNLKQVRIYDGQMEVRAEYKKS